MKKVLFFFISLCMTQVSFSQIYVLDFDANNTGYVSGPDGFGNGTSSTDYYDISSSGFGGTYNGSDGQFMAAQDIDGVQNFTTDTQEFEMNGIDISNYTNLSFSFDIAEDDDGSSQDWDAADQFLIEVQIDGGGYIEVFEVGTNATNQEPMILNSTTIADINTAITNTFTNYGGPIAGTGGTIDIRITFNLNSGDEDIAFDNFIIDGDLAGGTPGINLTDPVGNTSETGTTTTFTAVLNSMPTTDVVLDVTSGNTAENTVSPAMLTFTSTDWDDPQTITVTGVDDADFDGDQTTTITVATNDAMSDDAYDGLSATKDVINEDDEVILTCLDDMTCEFEIVPVTSNSQMDDWTCTAGAYNVSGFTGTGGDDSELWLIYGELDMTGVSYATFNFDLSETFSGSQIEVMWTNAYTGCPGDAGNGWTSLGIYMDAVTGESIDISSITGTTIYIGIKYTADGSGGGSSDFTLTNITTEADVCPTVNTPVTSSCVMPTSVSFASTSASANEDDGMVDVCVSITNPSTTTASTVEIDMDVSSTASNGIDFTMITFPSTLTFPANSVDDQCLTIEITDDGDIEPGEDLILNLQNPAGGEMIELGVNVQSTLTIEDNDTPVLTNEDVRINEVDSDQAGSDAAEFIELFGTPNLSLNGLVVVLYNGSDDASYAAYDLDGFSLDANGFLLIGTVGNIEGWTPEIGLNSSGIQNGADAVALYIGNGSDFPNDTPISQTGLIDALVHKTGEGDDAGLNPLIVNQPFLDDATEEMQVDEDENGMKDDESIQRGSWFVAAPTPRAENTVPVDFVSFNASVKNKNSYLKWTTAQEINNEKFIIERATDDNKFTSIGEVKGNENTHAVSHYEFIDENPTMGSNYYRLKQIDFDGDFEFSNVVKVDHFRGGFTISPTRTQGIVTITSSEVESFSYEVVSTTGSIMMNKTATNFTTDVDLSTFGTGVYFIRVNTGSNSFTTRVIKI